MDYQAVSESEEVLSPGRGQVAKMQTAACGAPSGSPWPRPRLVNTAGS